MPARGATPKVERPDRAEAARQRLAAKTSGSRRTGPLLGALPAPKTLVAGRSMAWIMWAAMVLNLVGALALGKAIIAVFGHLVHAGYYANFSRSDLAFQVRVVCLVLTVLGAVVPSIRLALYMMLLALVVTELLLGYNAVERALYLLPFNRRENPEEFSIDFFIRAFTEAPSKSGQAGSSFSMKPKASGAEALGAVSSKKSKKG
ncbi:unnamed protein product [Cladocopium goreaui]|uniref:PRA1 family protein n=1 Tax=Cladocopium goreaui TaxID=2562237 RepID=A0A9P1CHH4_9DINO|nr:unnamed protein product [Cladocopium goreaui]|mmetsp:Transcript_49291/g.107330  ORF Transcript_49291/g.107330 Transcript_49291/m.107330 type:complete len:204 (+) Transcript_49291:65-676(+)